ncbi:restriction endonuclease subunit S [Flavobacterium frigoris]|uniref:Type I restriction-modification system, specificity subunit S n=1 Tax=Flavobacterium frigoris (strain PS1) TaxID=1086011 RepID=H7FW42_FLAFP|nr:restriction endonuclease subunit S [Flavobacterium frigoris]EIA07271.1 type I restriction-modification system, specificity subunit S [Flavobacterium frigoris PS1]
MSYLKSLLVSVDVEWKDLGEVAEYVRGLTYSKKNESSDDSGFKVLRANNITLSSNTINFDNVKIINFDTKIKDSQKLYKNDIFISAASGSREHVGKVAFIYSDIEYYFGGFMGVIRVSPQIESRFLFHLLTSNLFTNYLDRVMSSSTINNLSSKIINGFQIPIPSPNNPEKSLQIQKEIARILDTFTDLTTQLTIGLTTELNSRKKQYSYYREQLLTFNESETKHLQMDDKSLGEFIRGKRFVKTDLIKEGVPTIHYGEMYTHYGTWADETISFVSKKLVNDKNLRVANKGDVVIVAAGETIEDIGKGTAWLGEEGVVIHDACFYYKSDLNPKYVAYFTRTRQFHDQIKKHIRTGKISAINASGLGKAIIPVPSKEEQESIVNILDKLDVLTASISENLPKEIELRKKQYEYYRNKLLTFSKDAVEV